MSYFKNAKVGDKVWDYIYGDGEIIRIEVEEHLSITVFFGNNLKSHYYYWVSGKQRKRENQRLFYYDNRPIVITQDDMIINEYDQAWGISDDQFYDDMYIGAIDNYTKDKYTRKVHRETPKQMKYYHCCAKEDGSYSHIPIETPDSAKDIMDELNKKCCREVLSGAEGKTHIRGIRLPDGCKYLRCRVNGNEFVIEIESEKIGTPADFNWA